MLDNSYIIHNSSVLTIRFVTINILYGGNRRFLISLKIIFRYYNDYVRSTLIFNYDNKDNYDFRLSVA